jgi:hypothetical protein
MRCGKLWTHATTTREALDPIIKFWKYKAYELSAIRKFYSLLRAAMMSARRGRLLHRLINDQTLPSIMARIPLGDWKQWAKERPQWIHGSLEEAFWKFIDQNWRDLLNVMAAEPASMDYFGEFKKMMDGPKRGDPERPLKKCQVAGVNVRAMPRTRERGPRKCKFSEIIGCTVSHPPGFGKLLIIKIWKRGAGSLRTTSCVHSACFMAPRKCATQ